MRSMETYHKLCVILGGAAPGAISSLNSNIQKQGAMRKAPRCVNFTSRKVATLQLVNVRD